MGIVINALVIAIFGLLGNRLRNLMSAEKFRMLGICIVIVSLVGFFENVYTLKDEKLVSENLILLLFAFMVGNELGERLHIKQRLSNIGKSDNAARNAVIDSFLFFGIGGLQICGPIAMVTQGDNSQLLLKSMIDIPFAIMFGATYGPWAASAAVPVALTQVGIGLLAWLMNGYFTEQVVKDLCSLGFIILFFFGFNLLTDRKNKVDNVNMLPSVFIVLIYYGIRRMLA